MRGAGGEAEDRENRNDSCSGVFPNAQEVLEDHQCPPLWDRPTLFLVVHLFFLRMRLW